MGLFNIFKNNKSEKRSYYKFLTMLAAKDETITPEEKQSLFYAAQMLKLTGEDLEIVSEMREDDIEYPKSQNKKIELVNDLVLLMVCDSKIEPREYLFCFKIALALDLNPLIIDEAIEAIIKERSILPHLNRSKLEGSYYLTKAAIFVKSKPQNE